MNILRDLSDRFYGRGAYSVSVPPMDGALQPNHRLDAARRLYQGESPDNLCTLGGGFIFSDGAQLFTILDNEAARIGGHLPADVLAMCSFEGGVVLILADGTLWTGAPATLRPLDVDAKVQLAHATAAMMDADGSLIVAIGSSHNPAEDWSRDLMQRRSAGSVWRVSLVDGAASELASGLAWPAGLITLAGKIYVSEAWRHRIISLQDQSVVLAQLPGYPGKLSADGQSGALLAVFAPRSQLIELVLREPVYRRRMMEEVPQHLWVAPSYASGKSFLEPLQGGGVRQMGILKPWAPSRSYGLLVQLDSTLQPIASLHSRADGKRHGISSAIRQGGEWLATSRGSGELIAAAVAGTVLAGADPAAAATAEAG